MGIWANVKRSVPGEPSRRFDLEDAIDPSWSDDKCQAIALAMTE
jgi:hypothetical protein